MIILRGFAPARQGPFVSAKGPKTIFAPAQTYGDLTTSKPKIRSEKNLSFNPTFYLTAPINVVFLKIESAGKVSYHLMSNIVISFRLSPRFSHYCPVKLSNKFNYAIAASDHRADSEFPTKAQK